MGCIAVQKKRMEKKRKKPMCKKEQKNDQHSISLKLKLQAVISTSLQLVIYKSGG
jgi:hypothetical protein